MEAEAKLETKIPVTVRVLIQRINRALRKRDGCFHGYVPMTQYPQGNGCLPARVVRKSRDHLARLGWGEYFYHRVNGTDEFVDPLGNLPDLEDLARELGVLKPWKAIHTAVDDTHHG